MDFLKEKLSDFWEWIPKWQFYGAIVLAVLLWVVRQFSLARVVVLVAAVAWVIGFTISRTDMAQGFGTQALHFGVLAGGALAVILFWFLGIRRG